MIKLLQLSLLDTFFLNNRWDKAFQLSADPSGRAVMGVHVDAYEKN